LDRVPQRNPDVADHFVKQAAMRFSVT